MRARAGRAALAAGLALSALPSAFAWWATGHMVLAALAGRHLTQEAADGISADLAAYAHLYPGRSDLVTASEWMDHIKRSTRAFNQWHFKDKPVLGPGAEPPSCEPDEDVLWAVEQCAKTLAEGPAADPWSRSLSLRFLLHLLGDLHQPMHSAEYYSSSIHGDMGGNLVHLEPAAAVGEGHDAGNLHSFWDGGGGASGLERVASVYPAPPGSTGVDLDAVGALAEELDGGVAAEAAREAFGEGLGGLMEAVRRWGEESHQVAVEVAYAGAVGEALGALGTGVNTSAAGWGEYTAQASATVRAQLTKGGGRAAAVLNSLYAMGGPGAEPAPPPPLAPPAPCPGPADAGGGSGGGASTTAWWQSAGLVGALGVLLLLALAAVAALAVLYHRERKRRQIDTGLDAVAFSVLSDDDVF